jgi:hypothetical protein
MLINNFLSFIYFLKDDDFLDPPLLPYNEGPRCPVGVVFPENAFFIKFETVDFGLSEF